MPVEQTIRVRNLGPHAKGYWIAEVALDYSEWTPVHRRWGSWMVGHGAEQRDVMPEIAAALQVEVRKAERKERRDEQGSSSEVERETSGELPEHPEWSDEHDQAGKDEAKEIIAEREQ